MTTNTNDGFEQKRLEILHSLVYMFAQDGTMRPPGDNWIGYDLQTASKALDQLYEDEGYVKKSDILAELLKHKKQGSFPHARPGLGFVIKEAVPVEAIKELLQTKKEGK